MTLEEELHKNDMKAIIDSMTAYAYSRVKIDDKDLEGKTPEDFVSEVFMKVLEGERDWSKATCSFKEFLFGCLKSHMSNFLKSFKQKDETQKYRVGLSGIKSMAEPESELKLVQIAIEKLKTYGSDKEEVDVFECWADGIDKPSEIADLLGKEVKEVYNITKRLERKLPKLQTLFKKVL